MDIRQKRERKSRYTSIELHLFIAFLNESKEKHYIVDSNCPCDPYFYTKELMSFLHLFKMDGITRDEAVRTFKQCKQDNDFINTLDEGLLSAIIFQITRNERFCSGLIATNLSSGFIKKILLRLAQL